MLLCIMLLPSVKIFNIFKKENNITILACVNKIAHVLNTNLLYNLELNKIDSCITHMRYDNRH